MNGPTVILLLVLGVVPICILLLRLDAWMTERDYQRRQRGDESARFAAARDAVRRQTAGSRTRIGHKENTK